ncbi:amino acid ABC transporter substrate-binding protein (PAAT family) [Aureibacillus halotolerans]|uniref:Amino acid ABC transporter substrate-binding protein (PAAT family) n=2 Tax=Aureibacillus halotolerans TaxID=1508390 RepID=A0A4R6TS44_9BACI|nr:amino acid ABC transporter substrate-binding protein (PAAT family) [Aureibacillus halotolerans]
MKKLFTAGVAALGLAAMVGCTQVSDSGTMQKIENGETLTVGYANERPYGYSENGQPTGMSVDISSTIFKELGAAGIEGDIVDFGSLINGLNSSQFDAVTAGMYITPDRCENAMFAEPEYRMGEGLAVAPGNPHDLHSYTDILENQDITVTVMTGGVEYGYLMDMAEEMGIEPTNIKTVNTIADNVAALQSGRTDAITMTEATLLTALKGSESSQIEVVEDFEQPIINGEEIFGYGSTVFAKGDEALLEAYNEKLAEMKESGELVEIYEKYGLSEENLPGDVTTEELCGA